MVHALFNVLEEEQGEDKGPVKDCMLAMYHCYTCDTQALFHKTCCIFSSPLLGLANNAPFERRRASMGSPHLNGVEELGGHLLALLLLGLRCPASLLLRPNRTHAWEGIEWRSSGKRCSHHKEVFPNESASQP